MEKVIEQ